VSQEITELLLNWNNGDREALNRLIPLVYKELYWMAKNRLNQERSGHTLEATALVNETYLRLVKLDSLSWQNRAHFFAIAAQLMRNILVDYARKQIANKRIGARNKLSLAELPDLVQTKEVDLVALDDALTSLAAIDPQQSRIIEIRFFGGLTIEETAEVMKLSPKIVRREWDTAKLWLLRELSRKS
jgi:RNA polymerase sigma factor (TIGR02999 family)